MVRILILVPFSVNGMGLLKPECRNKLLCSVFCGKGHRHLFWSVLIENIADLKINYLYN